MIGAVCLVAPLAGNGLGRAHAGERLIEQARPAIGDTGIVQLRADTDLVISTGGAVLDGALPDLAVALGLSEAELDGIVAQGYPRLAEADARRVELGTALDGTVSNLEAHTADFAAADSVPVAGVSPVALPVAVAVLGLVLMGLGFLMRRRRRSRWPVHAVAALGLVMVVGPLVAGLPAKVARAENLLGSLTTTPENAARTREQFDLTTDAVAELRTGLLPDAARALGVSTDELVDELVGANPDLAGVERLDGALANIEADVRFREERLADFALVKPVPFVAVTWLFIAAGSVLALLGVLAARSSPPRQLSGR